MSTSIQSWRTPTDFPAAWQYARALGASAIVPKHLRNVDPNATTATVISLMALSEDLGVSVVSLMQHTHVVSDKIGYSAAFMLARINASKRFKGGVQFKTTGTAGKDLRTVAYGLSSETGEVIEAPAITWEMAQVEGWTKSSKYKSMPEVMFCYRAASLFARLYCADLLFGATTSAEELETEPLDITPVAALPETKPAALAQTTQARGDDIAAKKTEPKPKPAPKSEPAPTPKAEPTPPLAKTSAQIDAEIAAEDARREAAAAAGAGYGDAP